MKKIVLLFSFLLMIIPAIIKAEVTTSTVTTPEELMNDLWDETVDIVKLGNDITWNQSNSSTGDYGVLITQPHKTLDLNGHVLTHEDSGLLNVNFLADNTTFEITDSVGTGKINSYGKFLDIREYMDTSYENTLIKLNNFDYENTHGGTRMIGIYDVDILPLIMVEKVDFFYPSNSPLSEGYDLIIKSLTVTPTDDNPVGFYNDGSEKYLFEVIHPDSNVYVNGYLYDDWENTLARDAFLGAGSTGKIEIKDHCTIKFETNGGSLVDDINVPKGTEFSTIKPENPTKDGYRFFSWYLDGSLHDKVLNSYVVKQDLYLHAKYGRFYNVITYDKDKELANDGGFIRTDTGYEGTNNGGYILEGEPHFLEQHANPGNLFVGWVFDDPTGTPFSTDDILDLTYEGEVYGNIYAVFEKGVEVTFETNGGTNVDGVIIRKGTKVGVPENPTKDGYRFGGWYLSNTYLTEFDFNTELTEDTTIYAKWIKTIDTISISYNEAAMPFIQDRTNEELIDWLRHNTISNTNETFVYDNSNTSLYKLEDSTWSLVPLGEEIPLGLEDEYAVMYGIGFNNESTNEFPINIRNLNYYDQIDINDISGFTFIVNGKERDDIKIGYSESWNCIMIYVPLGKALEKVELVKPTIKASADNNKITITWNEQLGATKYRLYSSTDNKKWTKETETTGLSYVIKGLTYGKKYYYKVRAYDKDGKSIYSDVINKTIKPNKVKLNIKSAGTNNVKLNWDKVSVTGYQVSRSTDNKKWENVKTIKDSKTLEYNNKSLKANKTYYYKVRAYKTVSGKNVYGSWSSVVSTKTAPNKPEVTLTLRNYQEVNIKMESSKGATHYIIGKSLDGKTYEQIHDLPGPGVMADGLNEIGKTYYYRVKVCNNQNRCSGWVTLDIVQSVLTPSIKVASTTSKKVEVKVGNVENAEGFKVYRSTSKNGKYETIKEIKAGESLIFNDKTKKGETYYYKVRAYSKGYDGKRVFSPYSGVKKVVSK